MGNVWGISPYGIDFLKKKEGYTSIPQWDYKQWSSGYGTRAAYPGEQIDKAEAERRLVAETGKVTDWLKSNITYPLNENQEDALTSFGYNLGTGNLKKLKGDINAGNWASVIERMPSFNHAGGSVNSGLTQRRADEVALLQGSDMQPTLYDDMTPYLSPFGAQPQPQQPRPAIGSMPATAGAGGPVPINLPDMPNQRKSRLADALLQAGLSAKPTGWGSLLNSLGDLALGYSMSSKADEQQKAYQGALAKALSGAPDNDTMIRTMLASGDPQMVNAAVSAKMAANKPQIGRFKAIGKQGYITDTTTGMIYKQQNGSLVPLQGDELANAAADSAEYGTTANEYVDAEGKRHIYQLSKAGGRKDIEFPDGATPGEKLQFVDTGTGTQPVSKTTAQPVGGLIQKDLAGKAAQTAEGKALGEAKVDLPRVESNADNMIGLIDSLETDPYLSRMTGPIDSHLWNVSGDANRVQSKADQLHGQAFLQAFQSLKGGGQITEVEGRKATDALSRLQTMGVNDKDYGKALSDFKIEVNRLREIARKRAGGSAEAAPSAPSSGGRLRFNPETGELE